MARRGLLRGGLARALLAAWCLSLLGLTLFLKDPVGAAGTWYGEVHKLCTVVNFGCLPALGALVWWRFRGVDRWRTNARIVGVLTIAHVAAAVPFGASFLVDGGAAGLGLVERCVVVLDVGILATLGGWSRAMAAPR